MWGRLAKWVGKQIAAKAVQLVLGTAIVTGAAMTFFAWVQQLPLADGFLYLILGSAGVVVLLNQARAFIVSYSVAHKLPRIAVTAEPGTLATDGSTGYSVKVFFQNQADVPLEYNVARGTLQLDERVARQTPGNASNTLPPGQSGFHDLGVVPMEWRFNAHIKGELEFTLKHGRVGKIEHERTEKLGVYITTDERGGVSALNVYAV